MAVKPPPKIGNNPNRTQLNSFINKGGKVEEKKEVIKTTMLIPTELIEKMDQYCKKSYQSRSAFIIQAIIKQLGE